MTLPRPTPIARATALALVTAMLTLAGPALPAHAAGCASEVPVPLPPSACDDVTPPDTQLTGMTPEPNDAGLTNTQRATFTFEAVNTDPEDTDEMLLECKLEGPSQAHDWQECTSPRTYQGLADTDGDQQYTFSVRAFDSDDRAIDYDDPSTLFVNEDEISDEDATPETRSWQQDSVDPTAFVLDGPDDSEGTGWPIITRPKVVFTLFAAEDSVSWRCQLDGINVACDEGRLKLKKIKGGEHTFTARVTDRAGNDRGTPATVRFVAPYNLTKGRGWSKKKSKGSYRRDLLQSKESGARIKFKARNIREVRVIAPAGRKLGRLRVRLGDGPWRIVNLKSKKAAKQHVYVVRERGSLFSGPVHIEALPRRGRPARVDALVFPHS